MLPKVKYLLLALLGSLFVASPAFAAAPAASRSNEVRVKTEVQTRACQAKQQVVRTRMENLLRLSSTMVDVFGGIQNRVNEFYRNRVEAKGGSASNYNELAQDVKMKKVAAENALATAKTDSGKFSCDNEDPKETLGAFRKDMQEVKASLKDYRVSIKNLIVAVKRASSTVPTPEPSAMMEK